MPLDMSDDIKRIMRCGLRVFKEQKETADSHQCPSDNSRSSIMKKLEVPILSKAWVEFNTHVEVIEP
jgi:hypothetical protein